MRQKRRELRTEKLIQEDKENDDKIQAIEFEQSRSLDPGVMKYSIWRRDFESPISDSTLKLMRDQIILAKAYAQVALANNETSLYKSLMQHCSESQHAIGDATSDAELHPRYSYFLSSVVFVRHIYLVFHADNSFYLFQCT